MLKQQYNVGIVKDDFTSNVKTPQVSKAYPAEKQYICMQYQNKTFESTLLLIQYQKTEEIKELKQKYENAK